MRSSTAIIFLSNLWFSPHLSFYPTVGGLISSESMSLLKYFKNKENTIQ